ncbi:hypothetical protein Gotri_006175 [Gossypium trilobum]|uniref:Uncharacterized protein n=1 Tax=Gossypium trilobum TaxID=34281 RepID=A0A7J9EZG6_9ROSI|nr:hypothetical protein [Gossypium trilobum]
MESFSFFLNQLTTDVLVRSEDATTHLAVDTDDNDDDDGPFFDLEFAVTDEDEIKENVEDNVEDKEKVQQEHVFTVKFKVEEVPIMFLFSKDNGKSQKQQSSDDSISDEKRFSKYVMQRYLKQVKPLYVKVSRRYGEKLRFSGHLNPPSTAAKESVGENQVNVKSTKRVDVPAGLNVFFFYKARRPQPQIKLHQKLQCYGYH